MDWVRIKNGNGTESYGHAHCAEAYNSAIDCGLDSGDCGEAACCFSRRYNREVSLAARAARMAAREAAKAQG